VADDTLPGAVPEPPAGPGAVWVYPPQVAVLLLPAPLPEPGTEEPRAEVPPAALSYSGSPPAEEYLAPPVETAASRRGEHILAVSNLHKKFGRKEVVRGVNFSMGNGEVAGLLGPNGAGKTTIFYMIVGFYKPSMGTVTLNTMDITDKPMYRRAQAGIAYLPQEASIFRKLTVEQNLWAILESRRDINKIEKKEKLESLLDEFGIGRIRPQYGYTLSGGERRRTEIARALATEPKFLLLDEPFAGIDPIAVYEIKQIIRRLAEKGIGILITDHNVRDTLEITTEAFIIAEGNIVARGGRDEILANEMVREVYLGSEFKM
jgi:lipopolysaccharide export system ATP-binding protein